MSSNWPWKFLQADWQYAVCLTLFADFEYDTVPSVHLQGVACYQRNFSLIQQTFEIWIEKINYLHGLNVEEVKISEFQLFPNQYSPKSRAAVHRLRPAHLKKKRSNGFLSVIWYITWWYKILLSCNGSTFFWYSGFIRL